MLVLSAPGILGQKESIAAGTNKTSTSNFIIIFVDDMGCGDKGTFGHSTIIAPNPNKMSDEG